MALINTATNQHGKMKTQNVKNQLVATLPYFPGFYYSCLDSLIDRELEYEMENTGEAWEQVEKRFSYEDSRDAIARAWVNAFASHTGIPVEWESMKSPREYNFQTDRVFVTLPIEEVQQLRDQTNDRELREAIQRNFTSRDGFISFYSDSLEGEEWQKPIQEWDHNQLMTLLEAWLTQGEIDPETLQQDILEEPRVYEAANNGWIS